MSEFDYGLSVEFKTASGMKPIEFEFNTGAELQAFINGLMFGMKDGERIFALKAIEPKITQVAVPGIPLDGEEQS